MSSPDPHLDVQAGLDALAAAVSATREGDQERLEHSLAAFRRSSTHLDPQLFLNTPLPPRDGGPYSEGLMQIIGRIPLGWGRWISCGPGWYALLCELDQQISALWPNYEVYQVKEKYGCLRYYADLGDVSFRRHYPEPLAVNYDDDAAFQAARAKWQEAWETWQKSKEGRHEIQAQAQARQQLWPQIKALITSAQQRSTQTCEHCGQPGQLRQHGDRLSTRCLDCLTADPSR